MLNSSVDHELKSALHTQGQTDIMTCNNKFCALMMMQRFHPRAIMELTYRAPDR